MSVENVKAFFKRLEEDAEFGKEFLDSGFIKDDVESLIGTAAKLGFSFTKDDLDSVRSAKADGELNEDKLSGVSGGSFQPDWCDKYGCFDYGQLCSQAYY